jgi:hypothetical protein
LGNIVYRERTKKRYSPFIAAVFWKTTNSVPQCMTRITENSKNGEAMINKKRRMDGKSVITPNTATTQQKQNGKHLKENDVDYSHTHTITPPLACPA